MSLQRALVFFALFIFCLFYQISGNIIFELDRDDRCTTPNNQPGECRPYFACGHILEVFRRNETKLPAQKQYLMNATCKMEYGLPILCCDIDTSPCITPEDQVGTCVPMDRCPPLSHFFRTNSLRTDYKEASKCEYEDAKEERFCCPLFTDNISGHIKDQQNLAALSIDELDESDQENLSGQNLANPLSLLDKKPENRVSLPEPGEAMDQCGASEIEDKIINGQETDIYAYPWMVLLRYGSGQFACGGSLINKRYVLTAAHCVRGENVRMKNNVTMVRLGEWDLSTDEDCKDFGSYKDCAPKPVDIPPEEIIVHKDYTEGTLENDIALIRLQSNVEFSSFVKAICLAKADLELKKDDNFTVAGWGQTEMGAQSNRKLFLNTLALKENSRCGGAEGLKESQLCIGSRIGFGTCNGDSGGPLMTTQKITRVGVVYFQIGIVSYGTATNCGQRPTVFTKVQNYIDWIKNNMRP